MPLTDQAKLMIERVIIDDFSDLSALEIADLQPAIEIRLSGIKEFDFNQTPYTQEQAYSHAIHTLNSMNNVDPNRT